MKFTVTKASDWSYRGLVEIKTLEELLLFMEFYENDVIIYKPKHSYDDYELRIYDTYVE